jgi:hypothetical protein
MTTDLTRRAMLRGSAAVPIMAAVPAAALSDNDNADAELIAWGQELARLRLASAKSGETYRTLVDQGVSHEEAHRRTERDDWMCDRIMELQNLVIRRPAQTWPGISTKLQMLGHLASSEIRFGGRIAQPHEVDDWDAQALLGVVWNAQALLARERAPLPEGWFTETPRPAPARIADPDRELLAAVSEWRRAYEQWHATEDVVEGTPEADMAYERHSTLLDRIPDMRARTPAGVAAKMKVADIFENFVDGTGQNSRGTPLLRSTLADLERMT